jgi:hypothetical protein
MSERHLEEKTLNGFKQDLFCTQEKRGERTNKKTMSLTVCETGPRVTQLNFSPEYKDESEATTDSTHY